METKPLAYYRWKIGPADLNGLIDAIEAESAARGIEVGGAGLTARCAVTANSPPTLGVSVAAGAVVDRTGARARSAVAQAVDLHHDREGHVVSDPPLGMHRWLTVQAKVEVVESVPVTDGHGATVNSRATAVRSLQVVVGELADDGDEAPLAEPDDDCVVVCDVHQEHGAPHYHQADVSLARQEVLAGNPALAEAIAKAVGDGVLAGQSSAGVQVVPILLDCTANQSSEATRNRTPAGGWKMTDPRLELSPELEPADTGIIFVAQGGTVTIRFYGCGCDLVWFPFATVPAHFHTSLDGSEGAWIEVPLLENELAPDAKGCLRFYRTTLVSGLALGHHELLLRFEDDASFVVPMAFVLYGAEALAVEEGECLLDGAVRTVPEAAALVTADDLVTRGVRVLAVLDPATGEAALVKGEEVELDVQPDDHSGEEMLREHGWGEFNAQASIRGGSLYDPAVQAWSLEEIGVDPANGWVTEEDGDVTNLLTEDTDTFFAFAFEGTGIDVYLMMGDDKGIAKVWVQGCDRGESTSENLTGDLLIDCYAPLGYARRHLVVKGLPWGPHVLYVTPNGTKNGSSSGTGIGLYGLRTFRIWRPATPATPAGKVLLAAASLLGQDNASHFPTWRRYSHEAGGMVLRGTSWEWDDSGGTPFADLYLASLFCPATSHNGDTVEFDFWGVGIWVTLGESAHCAHYTVDGGAPVNNNTHTRGLAYGKHHVVVTCNGGGTMYLSHLLVERYVDVDPPWASKLTFAEVQPRLLPDPAEFFRRLPDHEPPVLT